MNGVTGGVDDLLGIEVGAEESFHFSGIVGNLGAGAGLFYYVPAGGGDQRFPIVFNQFG